MDQDEDARAEVMRERAQDIAEREAQQPETQAHATLMVEVELYVCPTPGCGNYFGQKGLPDLSKEMNFARYAADHKLKHGTPYTHDRAECPDCRQRGLHVERVRVRTKVAVPTPVDVTITDA